jgi:hypothetical protein
MELLSTLIKKSKFFGTLKIKRKQNLEVLKELTRETNQFLEILNRSMSRIR